MQKWYKAVIFATVAGSVPVKDSTTALENQCPPGWIPGKDTRSDALYCHNCGLPDRDFIGCPKCVGQCSQWANQVCGPFSGHLSGIPYTCNYSLADQIIFPGRVQNQNPVECHSGSDYTINAQAYVHSGNTAGRSFSDMCGFLLNNCPGGIRDRAVIYRMGDGASIFNNTRDEIRNNDFSNYSNYALELTSLNKTC